MAVYLTAQHVEAALKEGRLMLLKRVNAPANVGKSPALVLVDILNRMMNGAPPPDGAPSVGEDPLLKRLKSSPRSSSTS